MEIAIDLSKATFKLIQQKQVLMDASIVHGCENTQTPTGNYQSGKWVKEKTNAKYSGPDGWSKDPWGNPYGPYFLRVHNRAGAYIAIGIHGTRGPGWSPFVAPPVPQGMLEWFVGEDESKYAYCSHGCIRLSNRDIQKLFEKTLVETRNFGTIKINITRSK